MAHRRRIFKGQLTVGVLVTLGFGLLLAGSIFISNQTVALRRDIAGLESRRECLEVKEGRLLTDYNAARKPEVIIGRGIRELGLVLPENPDLVLVCRSNEADDHGPSLAKKFFSKFGGASAAQAGETHSGLVTGTMVSLTPLNTEPSGAAAQERP
jgi:hypothetical protein